MKRFASGNPNLVVVKVWSFSNDFAEIPYDIFYLSKDSQNNMLFACSCPAYRMRKIKECKHIEGMFQAILEGCLLTNNHYSVTPFGMTILGLKNGK